MRQEGGTAAGQKRWDRVRQPKAPLSRGCSARLLSTGLDGLTPYSTNVRKCEHIQIWPTSTLASEYPAEVSRPSVTLGWGESSQRQSHKVDAERNTELLVTPGFSHRTPILSNHKTAGSPSLPGCLSLASQFPKYIRCLLILHCRTPDLS